MRLISCLILLILFYSSSFGQIRQKTKSGNFLKTFENTTLDSLQGSWNSLDEPDWQLTIMGRVYLETVKGIAKQEYRIYFSDTMVDCINLKFHQIKIDTTALSGNYILLRFQNSLEDFWTNKFYGFNWTKSRKTFSLGDTWAKRSLAVFRKVNR